MKIFSGKKISKNKEPQQKKNLFRLWGLVRPHRLLLFLSLLFALFSVALSLLVPILIGSGLDRILGPDQVDFAGLRRLVLAILLSAAGSAGAQWLMTYINNRLSYLITRDMRKQLFSHIGRLPLSYLDRHASGDLLGRVITDVDQVCDGLLVGLTQLFTGLITIGGTILFMIAIQPLLTLIVVILTPLSFFIAGFLSSRSFRFFQKQSDSRGALTDLTNEMVGNLKLIQTLGYQDRSIGRFEEENQRLAQNSLYATFYSSLTNPSTRFLNTLIYTGALVLGCFFCFSSPSVSGLLTVGQLTGFLSYTKQYSQPFHDITSVLTEFQNSLASAARIFELTDAEEEVPDQEPHRLLEPVKGGVEIRDLSFSYTADKPFMEDIQLSVSPGMRIAIVGPTGCGKTTLINLLMRFYEPTSGSISIDGQKISQVTRASLRQSCGMVLQETWLKAASIRDNIAYGRPDASQEEILDAARRTHAHSFITRLPDGYDTILEENGGNLSAGQKQLICIARVMLALPPILILDEATSSIDTRTELKIQQSFDRMMEGRTSFVVAHRLSTIQNADLILVMKDGKIIEKGRHDSLLAADGFYRKLYSSQFQ